MTAPERTRRRGLLIALGLVVVAAIAAVWIATRLMGEATEDPGADALKSAEQPDYAHGMPSQWADASPTHTVSVVDVEGRPAFDYQDRTLSLTPALSGIQGEQWEAPIREGTHLTITGTGRYKERPVTMKWSMGQGDPQAHFTMTLDQIPLAALDQPIVAVTSMGTTGGELVSMDRAMAPQPVEAPLDMWSPAWMQWRAPEPSQAILTFSDWRAARITRDGAHFTWSLWEPALQPAITDCPSTHGGITLTLAFTVTFGERVAAVSSRLPSGYLAAVSPVFVPPTMHPEAVIQQAIAAHATDWRDRARTLLQGHSSPDDARYGNGGLLGLGLGGAIVAPARFARAEPVSALMTEVATSGAAIAPTGHITDFPDSSLWMVAEDAISCDDYLEPREGAHVRVIMRPGAITPPSKLDALSASSSEEVVATQRPGLSPDHPTVITVPLLDGTRPSLVSGALGDRALDALVARRGIAWFATPMVASRNPLIGAAAEQILEPDRQGQWTMSKELARALANIELRAEASEILFRAPNRVVGHWQRARAASIRELPDGSLAIINPRKEPITGYTLVLPGDASPLIDDLAPEGCRQVTLATGDSQSWCWWSLKPGVTRVSFGAAVAPTQLQPTLWRLRH